MALSRYLFLSGVVLSLCAGVSLGAPMKLDFNHTDDITEAGWTGVNLNDRHDNGSAVDLGGGILAGCTGSSVMISRNRGDASAPATNNDLLQDFLQPGISGVCFKVTGLAPGTWSVTVITGDPAYPGETADDIDINGTVIALPDWPSPPTSATLAQVSNTAAVTVGVDGELQIQLGTTSYGKLAGLIIVPEPATLGLLALGGLGLIRRRRRG